MTSVRAMSSANTIDQRGANVNVLPRKLLSSRPSAYTRPRAVCALLVPRTAIGAFTSPMKRLRTAMLGAYFSTSSGVITFQYWDSSAVTVETLAGKFGSSGERAGDDCAVTITGASVVSASDAGDAAATTGVADHAA
ncbi:hypothetical protein BURKHO8Y_170394 [Burkholderia sp. 8Y]|nr:hypothetical protein BURKHO8Y_170394 [Burkholderia sp. 8Y]